MRILVVGSGGREHALCWAIAASPLCDKLYCAPGNAGIAADAECVPIAGEDSAGIVRFATAQKIDFVVVGPEVPLVAGLVDALEAAGIRAFGPSAKAAALEGSKGYMKDFCAKYGIPQAAFGRFRDRDAARKFITDHGAPIVIKTDGLAAGKGVTVAMSVDEALAAVDDAMIDQRFGAAGAELVIEEFLEGEEASFFALCDGTVALPLISAQDHKRVGDGDTGPNTGGMGAYSPAPIVTPEMGETIMARIVRPTMAGMAKEGRPYKGALYVGVMIGREGPKLVEFNVRFGDPETQVMMPRLASDLLPALMAARDGELKNFSLRWKTETALCVVMAAKGYPGDYRKGSEISGLDKAGAVPGVTVFHAGTKPQDGRVLANGGRVLCVTALGASVGEAQKRAYQAVDAIQWDDGFCRRDIGWRALAKA
jgi:phosphoribosylamine---glycine ligase